MLETLAKQYELLCKESPLASLRGKAWDALQKRGLPTKKNDAFRYFPLRRFLEAPVVNNEGKWKELDCISLPMEEALGTYRSVIEKGYLEAVKKEQNPFALTQLALSDPRFIYVPPGKQVDIPADINTNAFLYIGKGAEVSLNLSGKGEATFALWRVQQEAGSRLQVSCDLSEIPDWRLDAFRFSLKRDAKLEMHTYSRGAEGARHDIHVELLEENSEVDLRGLAVLQGKKEHHNFIHVHHSAPNCRSNQHYKNVLFDRAKASFEGKIFVEKQAQQTMAYQLNNNLLLGDHCIANSKPNLEIFADDVKASHGATMAQLEEEELFYLLSRGIAREEAKRLLIQGFCQAFFQQAPIPLRKYGV